MGLIGMQVVYWLITHPVNNFWLQREKLGEMGSKFFLLGKENCSGENRPPEWADLRNRWEYSHVVRAGLVTLGFVMLAIAVFSTGAAA
jgi:hypothetical protein